MTKNTLLHTAPSRSAPVVATLNKDFLWIADDALNGFQELEGWSAVRTAIGTYGFVYHNDVIDPNKEFWEFTQIKGKWMLTRIRVPEH